MDNTIAQLEPRRDRRWLRALTSNRFALAAAIVIVLLVLMAIFAPLVAPYDPKYIDPSIRLLGPSAEHRFGTDDFGRDIAQPGDLWRAGVAAHRCGGHPLFRADRRGAGGWSPGITRGSIPRSCGSWTG